MCPQAPVLSATYGSGRSAAMSTANHARLAAPDSPNTAAKLSRLTPEERKEVEGWPAPPAFMLGDVRLDYRDAVKEEELTIALSDGTESIGHADMYWVAEYGGESWAVVPDIKRQRYTSSPDSLQILAYTVAVMQKHGCERGLPGIYIADEGEYWMGDALTAGTREWWQLLARIDAAATHYEGPACTGPHCGDCYARLHCPEHLLPAALGDANPVLEPLSRGGEMTPDEARALLAFIKPLQDVEAAARAHLKAHVQKHGPVVDGDKQWAPVVRKGRETCSASRVRQLRPDLADELIYTSAPTTSHQWVKRR